MTDIGEPATADGITEYAFTVTVEGERVPAVVWTPAGAHGARPLVLMGHGASQHKKTESLVARAGHYARTHGWAAMAIDAQGHGERISAADADAMARDVVARTRGQAREAPGPSPIFKTMKERARRIVPEWTAALDVAQTIDAVGSGQPVGYWGLSMGTVLGVPFVAAEPRVTCAIFGLGGVRPKDEAFAEAARRITIPVQFTFQWDDAIAPRDTGLALFDAFGGREKTMHINPGGHSEIPSFENEAWEAFFVRHLGTGR